MATTFSESLQSNELAYPLTDAGNAEALANEWGVMFRYVYEWKSFIIYQSGFWEVDTAGLIKSFAIKTVRQLFQDTINIPDLELRKKAANWYLSSESDSRIKSMISLVSSQYGISITADKLDDKAWLLNVKNGTLDLKTGELHPSDPRDLLTQQIKVNFLPDAQSDEWENFLKTIFNNDNVLIDFIQRGIGYSLNGTQLERVFFFCYGLGKNGKSQLMDAIRRVISPYALEAKPELFMEKKFAANGPDEGQAALKGVRFLTATEIKRNQSLDVSLIKRMTGSEPIWHERKFQKGFSFTPTHTLWLSGNHEPQIKDTTNSIYDRLNKIPFDVRISSENEIKGYGEKLADAYGEAILAWCVKGAMEWINRGLTDKPKCVLSANEEYRSRQDILHDFLEDCVTESEFNITMQEMYAAFVEYCKLNDTDAIGKRIFNEAMRERGYKDKRGHGNKPMWVGVTLVTLDTKNQESIYNARAREKLSCKSVTEVTPSFEFSEKVTQSNQDEEILDLPED